MINPRPYSLPLFAALSLSAGVALATPDKAPDKAPDEKKMDTPKSTPESAATAPIVTAIRDTIAAAQTVGKPLSFKLEERTCVLTGEAVDLATKERVERWVAALEGVDEVDSQLTVATHAAPDAERANRFSEALRADEFTRHLVVKAEVDGTELELSGELTFSEKLWVLELAKQLPGIASIDDELKVKTLGDRAPRDAEIKRTLGMVFHGERRHDLRGVLVKVDEGAVKLTGTLRSVQAIDAITRLATIPGVTSIETELSVAWSKTGPEDAPSEEAETVPANMKDVVGMRLSKHPRLTSTQVKLTTTFDEGAVTLGGKVATLRQRDLALELVKNTTGVDKVHDRIVIETGSPAPSEAEIHGRVMASLHGRIALVKAGLVPRVERSRVIFTGTADATSRARVAEVAASVRGVTEVGFAQKATK